MPPSANYLATLPWPLFAIDFEASSLDNETYPIEVGVARWLSPKGPVEGWSTLIRPQAVWQKRGSWSAASQRVHGIGQEELANGLGATAVVDLPNSIIGVSTAYCDGGEFDRHWSDVLGTASSSEPTYSLGDIANLVRPWDEESLARMKGLLRWTEPCHQTRDDAVRLTDPR